MSIPRLSVLLLPILPLLASCSDEAAEKKRAEAGDPVEHFQGLVDLVAEGKLGTAYLELMPPSYASDFDQLVKKLVTLINEEEFAKIHEVLLKAGKDLHPQISLYVKESAPQYQPVVDLLEDVPKLLGISNFKAFKRWSITSLMTSLEENGIDDALEVKDIREWLGGVKISPVEITPTYVILKATAPGGGDEHFKVIRVDRRWFFAEAAVDWKRNMKSTLRELDTLAENKKNSPRFVMNWLEMMGGALTALQGSAASLLPTPAPPNPALLAPDEQD